MAKPDRPQDVTRPDRIAAQPKSRARRIGIGLVIIAIAICLADGPVLRNSFVHWDDHVTLYENPDLNPPTAAGLRRCWTEPQGHLYIPITYTLWWTLSAATRQVEGLNPTVFHAASLMLHMLSAWCVMAILLVLVNSVPAACAGALLFALHPVQVEAIAWASGAKDLLSAVLSLAAIGSYLLGRRTNSPIASRAWIALATCAFVLAMLSKPGAVIVPLLVVAVDWLANRRLTREAVYLAAIWLLLAVPIIVVTRQVQPPTGKVPPLWRRPIVAADAFGFYVQKIVWPVPLAIDYGRTPAIALASPWRNISIAGAAAVVIALAARRRPEIAVAVLITIAALLPYLGLVPFDFQQFSTVTDHYLYLAMFGPALLLAYLVHGSAWPWWTTCAAICGLFAVISFRQTGAWHDTQMLFRHTIAVYPDSVAAHHALGVFFADNNDLVQAEREYREALCARPNDPDVNTNLGNLLNKQGHTLQALQCYQRALEVSPRDTLKVNNVAIALAILGRLDEAEKLLRWAVEVDKKNAGLLRGNLGKVLLDQGRLEEAREEFQRALEADPNSGVARRGMEQLQHASP